jgi:hypothetical protein
MKKLLVIIALGMVGCGQPDQTNKIAEAYFKAGVQSAIWAELTSMQDQLQRRSPILPLEPRDWEQKARAKWHADSPGGKDPMIK